MRAWVVAIALLVAQPVHAEQRWYGWEILVVDGAAAGLVAIGNASHQDWMVWGGLGIFVLAGIGPHLLVRQPQRALYSFGARLANPLLFGYIGAKIGSCDAGLDDDDCKIGWPIGGLIFGAALAMAFDQTQAFLTLDASPSGTPVVGVAFRF